MLTRTALVALLLAAAADAQTSQVLVDLGTTQYPTNGSVPEAWNDLVVTNAPPFELVDTTGAGTGITWSLSGGTFDGANSAGTSSPQAGSPLAEFPISATRDVMYGSGGETIFVTLSGFAPNTLVDLTFAASRIGVGDNRTTDYLVQGFNGASAQLNPSNNTSMTDGVSGILPDASGTVVVSIRAAADNDNAGTHYFYLGAVRMDVTQNATPPAVLGFDVPAVTASRPQGDTAYQATVTVLELAGGAPTVALSAVDDATGQAPTWLTFPSSVTAGSAFTLSLDPGTLALGSYTATLTASATGYPDTELYASLVVRDPDVLNLLFYGNSYTIGNQGVAPLTGFIAEEAGHSPPNVVARLAGGQNLLFHLTDPGQAAAITDALLPGEEWDFVVMQGFSLEATNQLGDPAAFRANALAILTNVRAHSPDARAVMFQTWARGPGSSVYPNTYSNPLEMHDEIRTNYQLAVADMNAAFGAGTAFLARAGDAVFLRAFEDELYEPDWSHPEEPLTMIVAMTMYQAIWRERICDLSVDFTASTDLVDRLGSMGLGEAEWDRYAGYAERVADPVLRRFPGSSEDLVLQTGVNALANACPVETAGVGDLVALGVSTPNGLYAAQPAILIVDGFPTGSPPGTLTPYPEVHGSPLTAIVFLGKVPLADGLRYEGVLQDSTVGFSVLLQGLALGASATTGNPDFTVTDAHEIVLR